MDDADDDAAVAEDATPRTPALIGGRTVDVAHRKGAHPLHSCARAGAGARTVGRCVARTDMARAGSVTPRRVVLAIARRPTRWARPAN